MAGFRFFRLRVPNLKVPHWDILTFQARCFTGFLFISVLFMMKQLGFFWFFFLGGVLLKGIIIFSSDVLAIR